MGGGEAPALESIQWFIILINMCVGVSVLWKQSYSLTLIIILILCFYSVLEGIAIGVADHEADAWSSLWNLSLYKLLSSIVMGNALFNLLQDKPFLATVAYLFASIVASPIGVGIGVCIDSSTEGKIADWIFVVSSGFVAGIYMCYGVRSLISQGFRQQEPCYFDMPFVISGLVGVAVMALLLVWG